MDYAYIVSGFTQQRHNIFDNGSHSVHKALLPWQSPELSVRLLEWKEDPEGHAQRVAATTDQNDKVIVCAYSYGAGFWFDRFSKEMAERGRLIHTAVLCDPVYRHPNILMRWRAIAKFAPQNFTLPPNVLRVSHFYQTKTEPGGDKLTVSDTTELVFTKELDMTHQQIDNAREYLETAVKEATLLFGQPKG